MSFSSFRSRGSMVRWMAENKYMKEAPFTDPEQSPYMSEIHVLKDDPNFEL